MRRSRPALFGAKPERLAILIAAVLLLGTGLSMVDAFLSPEGHLGDRIIATMRAALKAGGEAGPVRSAGMKLVREVAWPVADLRCDWTEDCPIEQLASVWEIYKPQLDAYVTRALNPTDAPSYGVPGDE